MPGIAVHRADSIGELAEAKGVDPSGLISMVNDFNASTDRNIPFDPTVLDGRAAHVSPPMSNWASPIETGSFSTYPVTCGITFTFGGLKGGLEGRVPDERGPIQGLFVCGEELDGLCSGNYPGGSGLATEMVFGRRAGAIAQFPTG
ncbi:FAD-binding protein [Pseudarthrobacter sp. AL07]|uniref:FAD-binding protein n=1 Tax=unclassified Pseudarthrobacter TaxID=2647000 RepID=UPI00249AA24C|nr:MULTISPECIES: FAD-binding protein [unclassified Pseudarthrobacter]MDI3196028.1 FAD-binding protein [Pseudarthrobacter sp. AL20]MDI3210080.1 FAD-binding protein [Pseudarthrobacter sp. AL07]